MIFGGFWRRPTLNEPGRSIPLKATKAAGSLPRSHLASSGKRYKNLVEAY
jgi:hypothetical protein